ncbi:MAG: oxalate/formate MFS antiporter [Acidobacteriota bacterium]
MNRWIRLVAAVIAMVQIANLQYAWTLFVKPLTTTVAQGGHGWSLTSVQWAFTIFIALETWAMPFTGFLIDRHGARVLMTIAGLLCGVGWALIGTSESLTQLYMNYALAGFGAAIVYCGSMGVALKWFPDRRGLAAGLIAAGFGSGSALFIPLVRSLLSTHGYQGAFLYTGIIQGTLIVLAAQFLGGTGVPVIQAASKPQKLNVRGGSHHFASHEMLRTPQFYVLYAMMLMMGIGGLLATAQVAPVADNFGISTSALALSLVVNPIANGSGRLFWGIVSDRLGREQTMLIAFTLQALSLLGVIMLGPHNPTMFVISMGMVFFTWGEVYVLFPSACADFFGSKSASSNYSFLYSTKGVASIIAGGAAAALFESTHSWGPAFYGSAVLAAISATMAIGLKKMPLPVKPAELPLSNAATAER